MLNLLLDLKTQFGLTYLFISHDLNVVNFVADRVLVMYLGRIAEIGPVDDIFAHAAHPYTAALLDSRPSMDPDNRRTEPPLFGDPPNPVNPPSGCRFRTRCKFAEPVCADTKPPLATAMLEPGAWRRLPDGAARLWPFRGARSMSQELVHVRDLVVKFVSRDATVHAVSGVNFDLAPKETLCILGGGESGSGKSVTLRSLMRLNPPRKTVDDGDGAGRRPRFGRRQRAQPGRYPRQRRLDDLSGADDGGWTPCSPSGGRSARRSGGTRTSTRRRPIAGHWNCWNWCRSHPPRRRLEAYPHELSGGLRQRAMIAIALSCRPKLFAGR